MPDYLIHHMPGACSRIALNALEETGVPYRDRGVALMRGEQRFPEYLAINAKGKVPVLEADGLIVTELPVILFFLAQAHPDAQLLPAGPAELAALSDLVWISGVLHPLASRPMRPAAIAPADPEGVTAMAFQQLADHASQIETRLAVAPWWYGDRWSIVDMFIAWVLSLAAQLGFPRGDYPVLTAHAKAVEARPSFVRARKRELVAMERGNLPLPPMLAL